MLLFFLCFFSFAEETPFVSQPLLQVSTVLPQLNDTVVIKPLKEHHINIKSPNSCGEGQLNQLSEQSVSCVMDTYGKQSLEVFVCDNRNTYCKRESLLVHVQSPQGIISWFNYYFKKLKQ